MFNTTAQSMNDEEVFVDGISFYVYYDFNLSKDTTDFALQPTYEVTLRQCFNLKGEPVEPTDKQREHIENVLVDRLKFGDGNVGF